MKTLHPIMLEAELYDELAGMTRECLAACRNVAKDGTPLYYPVGSGAYAALWTRDFCYMVEGAGQFIPNDEILAGIEYLFAGQRDDGAIPDRVSAEGTPIYIPGPPDSPCGEAPAADNPPFMAKLVCAYVGRSRDYALLARSLPRLQAAMDFVPRQHDGLVYIDTNRPHSAYGFTDCIAKTGKELFTSLLYWEACKRMAETCALAELHDDAHDWHERAETLVHSLHEFWDEDRGMFRAASEHGRQIDIWGSAYAAVIRIATKSEAARIADFLLTNRDNLVLDGYVRHLLQGEYWQRLLKPVERDTYQNGGYWALPTGWVARTIALLDDGAAHALVVSLISAFRRDGVCEWVGPDVQRLPGYAASAATLLEAVSRRRAR